MKFLITFLFSALTLATCENNSSEKSDKIEGTTIFVNSLKVDCTGVAKMKCLQIQESPTLDPEKWQFFYDQIEGFEYQPGFIYKLSVKKEKLDPASVPADGSSIKYSLLEVLDKNKDPKWNINNKWSILAIDGKEINKNEITEANKIPALEINLNEMRVLGNDGCNSIFGKIQALNENSIVLTDIGGTEMACPNMELSFKYTAALGVTKTYKLEDTQLLLYDVNGKEVLKFQKAE